MHELSIAQSIYETVLREMEIRELAEVSTVGVRVGALSGVMADALQFSFEAIIIDSPLAGCKFTIEEIPVHGSCQSCGKAFVVKDFLFCCPICQSGQIEVTQGYELEIAYLEVRGKDEG